MRAMRDVMVHDYLHVVVKTVWYTLRNDLPALVPVLREILEREPCPSARKARPTVGAAAG